MLFKKIQKAFRVWRISVCNLAGTRVTKWHLGSKIQKIGPNPEDRLPKIKNFRPKNFSKNRILNFQYWGKFVFTIFHIAFKAYATLKIYTFSKIHTMFSPQNLWLIKPKIKWICSGSAEKNFFWSYRTTQILTFPISCIQIVMVGLSMTMEWSYMAQISLLITPDTFGT